MVTKKKFLNILYMFSLVSLFVMYLGLFSSCFALTSEEVTEFLDTAKEQMQEIEQNNFVLSWYNKAYNYTNYFANFDCISIGRAGNYYYLSGFNLYDNTIYCYYQGGTTNQFVAMNLGDTNRTYMQYGLGNNVWGSNTYNIFASTSQNTVFGGTNIISNTIFYNGLNSTTEYIGNNYFNTNSLPQNSITLTSASNHKFAFSDKNQLQVDFTGEWTPADFTFYVERYIDNEWQTFTDSNDWYELNGYENPYYIFWPNINYFPVGTYRYCADYGNLHEQLFYSQSFEITSMSIDTPVDGTIDSDGNIDITVDNGNVVDNIKDYLGQEPDFDNVLNMEDIENAVDLDYIANPYENFILTFLDGLISSFTDDASDLTFKVHTWGQNYTISVADFSPSYNTDMRVFLGIISTIVWCFVIVRWVTSIIDGLTHMSIADCIDLIDAHYSNLF